MNPIRAAVLTVSDRCSRGEAEDQSGPALCVMLRDSLRAEIAETCCVPDAIERIAGMLIAWSNPEAGIDLILTTGGTGLSPSDVTPEAASQVFDRHHPSLMELARIRCLDKTPRAFLSRGVAGTIGHTLILTLPGSPRGATDHLAALVDVLPHAIRMLRGEDTAHAAPGA